MARKAGVERAQALDEKRERAVAASKRLAQFRAFRALKRVTGARKAMKRSTQVKTNGAKLLIPVSNNSVADLTEDLAALLSTQSMVPPGPRSEDAIAVEAGEKPTSLNVKHIDRD